MSTHEKPGINVVGDKGPEKNDNTTMLRKRLSVKPGLCSCHGVPFPLPVQRPGPLRCLTFSCHSTLERQTISRLLLDKRWPSNGLLREGGISRATVHHYVFLTLP